LDRILDQQDGTDPNTGSVDPLQGGDQCLDSFSLSAIVLGLVLIDRSELDGSLQRCQALAHIVARQGVANRCSCPPEYRSVLNVDIVFV
jgi:hypothetical protein